MAKYNNILENSIFSSFIISFIPDVSLENLKVEAYEVKNQFEGAKRTNVGGYQSPVFSNLHSCEKKEFSKLKNTVIEFTGDFLNERKYNLKVSSCAWWLNISQQNNYNVLHTHGRADLIAVFYIDSDISCSDFVLLRNDGSIYGNLYKNIPIQTEISIPPEKGRLYLMPGHLFHYVTTNPKKEDRISVSYNIFLD